MKAKLCKLSVLSISLTLLALLVATPVMAHVTVSPGEVLTASFQTFTVSVPNEKDESTTSLKLDIPAGLSSVTPNVKLGWKISIDKDGESEDAPVTAITWSNGNIPASLRDEFSFSARTPDEPTQLRWSAYQKYADDTVVAWDVAEDAQPKNEDGTPDYSKSGPFSVTKVTTVTPEAAALQNLRIANARTDRSLDRLMYLSVGVVFLGLASLYYATRKIQQAKSTKSKLVTRIKRRK